MKCKIEDRLDSPHLKMIEPLYKSSTECRESSMMLQWFIECPMAFHSPVIINRTNIDDTKDKSIQVLFFVKKCKPLPPIQEISIDEKTYAYVAFAIWQSSSVPYSETWYGSYHFPGPPWAGSELSIFLEVSSQLWAWVAPYQGSLQSNSPLRTCVASAQSFYG
jgi:hypothetical protein